MSVIRYAVKSDLPILLGIYNHYVRETSITFDEVARTLAEYESIFAKYRPFGNHRLLVMEEEEQVIGMASSQVYRAHPAFNSTVELSIYLSPDARHRGLGTGLYQALFRELRFSSLHRALVGVALPNEASVQLHHKLGFRDVGVFDEYAKKNGAYISSLWLQRNLSPHAAPAKTRVATTRDQEAIRQLIYDVLHEYQLKPDPEGTDRDLNAIEAEYFAQGGWFEVALDEKEQVIGSWALHREDSQVCELRKMYLHPEARGQGLGKYLLEAALAKAQAMGYRRVVLETASVLKEATALYRKYGFRPYEPKHRSPRCNEFMALDMV